MTPQERYATDPTFHTLVHLFEQMFEEQCGSGAGITPSEIREASGFAYQRYAERHAHPMLVVPSPEPYRDDTCNRTGCSHNGSCGYGAP